MPLEKYSKKRDFSQTGEPLPKPGKKSLKRFVIQEHNASRLHYDFRLETEEKDGAVLKSWAVPKNLPLKPGIKRLAVATEDHPIEYLKFKGEIPEGNYGAGTVKIWDRGKWKLLEGGFAEGRLIFELKGAKVNGGYAMIRAKGCDGKKDKRDWLVFKRKMPDIKKGA